MTRLVWGLPNQSRYQGGTDRGVLYPPAGAAGVPWNGLISVDENVVGGERTELHFDGIKYLDVISIRDYQASVKAFSAPLEFEPCIGNYPVIKGFFITAQAKKTFGFTYRTKVSNVGYKIHLVYNVLATPTTRGYTTVGPGVTPSEFQWQFDAVPPVATTARRPGAHLIVDSTRTTALRLSSLEDMLYGTALTAPFLPSIGSLITLFNT